MTDPMTVVLCVAVMALLLCGAVLEHRVRKLEAKAAKTTGATGAVGATGATGRDGLHK